MASVSRAMEELICGITQLGIKFVFMGAFEETQKHFYTHFGIPGVVGCVDGTHIRIQKPSTNEDLYYCRKSYHSINAMIVRIKIGFITFFLTITIF